MKRRATVLVADDERFFREAMGDVLGEAGIEPLFAASGAQALECAGVPEVGVVLLDIELPDTNGIEVFRKLREQRPDLRVIVVSAHTDQSYVLEALRLGAFDYLAKPIHEEELRLAVERALESHRVAADWSRLRVRLAELGGTLADMWQCARGGEDGARALRQAAVEAAAEVAHASRTSLLLMDEEGLELRVAAARGAAVAPEKMEPVPLGEGVAGWVAARGRPVVVQDVARDERFALRARPERYRSCSFAAVPLVADEAAFGVLCATDRADGEAFDAEDVALLQILTAQIAQLLHASQSAGPSASQTAPLANEPPESDGPDAELARIVCDAMTADLESERSLERALAGVARLLDASPVSVHLIGEGEGGLVLEAQGENGMRADRDALPSARGLTGTVLETGQIVACEDPQADPRFDAAVDTPEDGAAAPLLCGPIRFRGRNLGVFRAFFAEGRVPGARTGEVLAAALSAAVRGALLYRSLIDSIEELACARRGAGGAEGPPPSGR